MQREQQSLDLTEALAAITTVFGPVVVLAPKAPTEQPFPDRRAPSSAAA